MALNFKLSTLITVIVVIVPGYCVNIVSDYVLQDGLLGHCGQTITSEDSIYVRSHVGAGLFGGLTSYSSNQDCQIIYSVNPGSKILVKFPFFDLQPPSGATCFDKLYFLESSSATVPEVTTETVPMVTTEVFSNVTINETDVNITMTTENILTTENPATTSGYIEPSGVNATFFNTSEVCNMTESNTTLCWNVTESYVIFIPDTDTVQPDTVTVHPSNVGICETQGSYVSSSNSLTVRFTSDATIQGRGFTLLLTSFHEGTCLASEYQCDTNRCISEDLKCDGVSHCVDGADESKVLAGCTLLDDIIGTVTGLGQYAVLGIAVISAALVFTLFISVILWKFMHRDSKCQCSSQDDGDEESQPEPPKSSIGKQTTSRKQEQTTAPVKRKKSVTIASSSGKNKPSTEESPRARKPSVTKVKVEPVKSADVEW